MPQVSSIHVASRYLSSRSHMSAEAVNRGRRSAFAFAHPLQRIVVDMTLSYTRTSPSPTSGWSRSRQPFARQVRTRNERMHLRRGLLSWQGGGHRRRFVLRKKPLKTWSPRDASFSRRDFRSANAWRRGLRPWRWLGASHLSRRPSHYGQGRIAREAVGGGKRSNSARVEESNDSGRR